MPSQCQFSDDGQCFAEPDVPRDEPGFSWMFKLFCTFLFIGLVIYIAHDAFQL